MSIKTQFIGALFLTLVIILAVNPKLVNNIYYGSILGRIFLVCVVIFFAMCNTTLGLLVVLVIIAGLNQYRFFLEGMENSNSSSEQTITTNENQPKIVGDDNVKSNGGQTVLTNSAVSAVKKRISDLKDSAKGTNVVDSIITERNLTKDSKQIPVDNKMNSNSTGEVHPSSEGMLKPTASLEGFSSYATY